MNFKESRLAFFQVPPPLGDTPFTKGENTTQGVPDNKNNKKNSKELPSWFLSFKEDREYTKQEKQLIKIVDFTATSIWKVLKWGFSENIAAKKAHEFRVGITPKMFLSKKGKEKKDEMRQSLINNPNQKTIVQKIRDKVKGVVSSKEINYTPELGLTDEQIKNLENKGVKSFVKNINKTFKNAGITLRITADKNVSIKKLREIQMFILENAESFHLKGKTVVKRFGHSLFIGDPKNTHEKITERGYIRNRAIGNNPSMSFLKETLEDLEKSRKENGFFVSLSNHAQEIFGTKEEWTTWRKEDFLPEKNSEYIDKQIENPSSLLFWEKVRDDYKNNKWTIHHWGTILKEFSSLQENKNQEDVDLESVDTKKYIKLINKGLKSHEINIKFSENNTEISNDLLKECYFELIKNIPQKLLLGKNINPDIIYFKNLEEDDSDEKSIKRDSFLNIKSVFVGESPSKEEFMNCVNSSYTLTEKDKEIILKKKKQIIKIFLDEINQKHGSKEITLSKEEAKKYIEGLDLNLDDEKNKEIIEFLENLKFAKDISIFLQKISIAENNEEIEAAMNEESYESF